jgi:catechol 2,3-dioxygenase-like lactoylglutathione lyase family enzyme
MAMHRLLGMRVGVPDPDGLAAFYGEMGLAHDDSGHIDSPDGGTQVTIETHPFRRLLGVDIGVFDDRDLDAAATRAASVGLAVHRDGDRLSVIDPVSQVTFALTPAAPLVQTPPDPTPPSNAPGAAVRRNRRAPAVFGAPRPPRRLGHVVIGSPDPAATRSVLVDGLGFKVSDDCEGILTFLRCSTDHHNVALVHSPVPILQHYSWECDDLDHAGHLASALLRTDPARQTWGIGRHFAGSNFYWYLRDPSGSFIELYSDLDVIDDDVEWERSGRTTFALEHIGNIWGPDIPLEFIAPTDLPELQEAWAARS